MNEKNKARPETGKILKFAKRAEAQADIYKGDDKNIFEIIENRYRQKWTVLKTEEEKKE